MWDRNGDLQLNGEYLERIGFTREDVNDLSRYLYEDRDSKVVTVNRLQMYGFSYEKATRLKHMYDIATGKISIRTSEDLAKHLKKIYTGRRIGINDLILSRVRKVPRACIIGGIPSGPFAMYNSNRYSGMQRLYNVVSITQNSIVIHTTKRPVIKYGEPLGIDGVISVRNLENGKVELKVNKQHCILCNRFIIVARLKRPEFHLGLVEIIARDGTKVYVFAQTLSSKDTIRYNEGTERVYDYGFIGSQIKDKLLAVSKELYNKVGGVDKNIEPANSDFIVIDRVAREQEESEESYLEE